MYCELKSGNSRQRRKANLKGFSQLASYFLRFTRGAL